MPTLWNEMYYFDDNNINILLFILKAILNTDKIIIKKCNWSTKLKIKFLLCNYYEKIYISTLITLDLVIRSLKHKNWELGR